MPILQTKHLGKVYEGKVPYTALHDINFQMEKGEFVAIMGPSGSGKSTLLNVISTIDHPTSGSVTIDGKDPHTMKDGQLAHFRRCVLGFVFQDFNLAQTLTVGENIMLPLTLEGVSPAQMKKRTRSVAELLGLDTFFPNALLRFPADKPNEWLLPVLWWPIRLFYSRMSRPVIWIPKLQKMSWNYSRC